MSAQTILNNFQWTDHVDAIAAARKELKNDLSSCDVTFVAKGGVRVPAHRFVLISVSEKLRYILKDIPEHIQDPVILVPDVEADMLQAMISFIYLGESMLAGSYLSEFVSTLQLLGVNAGMIVEHKLATARQTSDMPILDTTMETPIENVLGPPTHMVENHMTLQEQPDQTGEVLFSFSSIERAPDGGYIITHPTNAYSVDDAQKVPEICHITELNECEGNNQIQTQVEGDPLMDESDLMHEEFNGSNGMIGISEDDNEHFIELKEHLNIRKPITKSNKGKSLVERNEPESKPNFSGKTCRKADNKIMNSETANLEQAVQAVLKDGCSLQKAASKHNVSKTVLWRRVHLEPAYVSLSREKPVLTAAFERLRQGNTLKSISTELKIPMSTLHRHKVRLSLEGRLPENVARRRRDMTPRDQMREKLAKAVHACVNEGMTQNHAAHLFEIPKSTLWRHMQRRQMKIETITSKEEPEDYVE